LYQDVQSEQHNILLASFAGSLTEGLLKAGELREALFTVNGALSRASTYGISYYSPELLRLKAEVLMSMGEANRSTAMQYLESSLRYAREQAALAYELRSTTTLARLLRDRGESEGPEKVLAPLYDRFTEGFETTDLRLAKLVMEQ
jgi:predicted ATPase